MLFAIDEEIFARFPGLLVGALQVSGLDNSGRSTELELMVGGLEAEIRRDYASDTLSLEPRIKAWREAYSSFGAKPKKYKSSVESLYRIILKGHGLRPINKIVDIYNYVSVKNIIPIGGDDLDKLEGNLRLCFARGGELFLPLNAEEMEMVRAGEVVYRDDKEVLCRRWNWRESDKTKMTEETRRVLLVAEALPPISAGELERIIQDLEEMITARCGGAGRSTILHKDLVSWPLD